MTSDERSLTTRRGLLLAVIGGGATAAVSSNYLPSVLDRDVTHVDTSESLASKIERSPAGTTIVLRDGVHKSTDPITVSTDNLTVVIPEKATLQAPEGITQGDRFIRVEANGITFSGGGTINGNLQNVSRPTGRGHEHILQVGNPTGPTISNFTLDGLTLTGSPGGDCLYINNVEDSDFLNFSTTDGYRNCISVINADTLQLKDFTARHARGKPPASGLGFEPNTHGESLNSIRVVNGSMRGNATFGTYINSENTKRIRGNGTIDITYENCEFAYNNSSGSFNRKAKGVDRLEFDSCHSYFNNSGGWEFGGVRTATLNNCKAWNNGNEKTASGNHAGVFLLADPVDTTAAPFVRLQNFEVYDSQVGKTQQHPGRVNDGKLRVIGSRVGPHAATRDGYYANGVGSTVIYSSVEVETNDVPAYSKNGGQTIHAGTDES